MSFGPCPSSFFAIGAPMKATRIRKMMKMPPAIATLSRLSRSQTPSQ